MLPATNTFFFSFLVCPFSSLLRCECISSGAMVEKMYISTATVQLYWRRNFITRGMWIRARSKSNVWSQIAIIICLFTTTWARSITFWVCCCMGKRTHTICIFSTEWMTNKYWSNTQRKKLRNKCWGLDGVEWIRTLCPLLELIHFDHCGDNTLSSPGRRGEFHIHSPI